MQDIVARRTFESGVCRYVKAAFLLKNATQARQAFHGSVLRRRDGTYHVVDFTGGVKTSGEAVCLMLKPLAGGPAKQFYPAELAQSMEWVHRAWPSLLVARCTVVSCEKHLPSKLSKERLDA